MQSNVRSRPRPGVFAAPEQRWFQWARRDPGPMRLCRDPLGRRDCRRTSASFRHVMPTIYDPRHYLPVPTCHPGLRVRISSSAESANHRNGARKAGDGSLIAGVDRCRQVGGIVHHREGSSWSSLNQVFPSTGLSRTELPGCRRWLPGRNCPPGGSARPDRRSGAGSPASSWV
jgi:hypothetical protein